MKTFQSFINEAKDPVSQLETELKAMNSHSYDSIDKVMRKISKSHNITPRELHNRFKEKHAMIPDKWVKQNEPN